MSNVETVQAMYAAFGRGDVVGVLSHVAEDCDWTMEGPASISWSGARRGHAEITGFFAGIANDSSNQKLNMTTFVSSGDDVAAFGRYEATMNATGKHVDSPVAHHFKFRDGKVVEYTNFVDTAAFADALKS